MDLGRNGLGKRRQPDPGWERRRLVVHKNKLRFPVAPRSSYYARLNLVDHVGIAIVVMADVLLVEARVSGRFVRGAEIGLVPFDDDVLPVRIERRPEHQNNLVKNRCNFRVVISG